VFTRCSLYRGGYKTWCRGCVGEYGRQFKAANSDRVKAANSRYRNENRARVQAAKALWKRNNRAKEEAYRARTRTQAKVRATRRKARLLGAPGTHTAADVCNIVDGYCGLCVYCLGRAEQIDHVEPLARGGSNGPENLVPACKHCNISKKDKPLLLWLVTRPRAA